MAVAEEQHRFSGMEGGCDSGSGSADAVSAASGLPSGLGLELFAASLWAIVVLDHAGHIQFINESGLALFEILKVQDTQGRPFRDLWPSSEIEALNSAVAGASVFGRSSQHNAYNPTKNGTPRWLEVAVSPVVSKDSESRWVMCLLRDITQHMAVQESLKHSQQRFRALADHMAQLAWMADETGHLFWYNQRWFEFTGTTMSEMDGWGWTKVQHPDHLDRVTQKWSAHLRNGEVWEDVFPLRSSDGTYRWFLSRAVPFRDAHDRIILWCGTNTDITEQRTATQRLRQKARLIELSHEAIFSWELDGVIVSWNRGCEELYGFKQSEAIGKISHELLRSQHGVPIEEVHKILVADGAWSGEILHYAKDGTKVWVDSRHEVLRVGGKSLVLETNRDITERRKADEIRNMLVAELNHRVKNTLAIVQSIASQTARSSANMRDYAESFRGRLQSLASAHNLLTDAHWYGADLNTLVRSEVDVTFGKDANVRIEGERVFLSPQIALHFTLILHELATNAVKHGALSCPSGSVAVTWAKTSDNTQLELKWTERGGPNVTMPTRQGFGTSLITRSGKLPNIKADLQFLPGGVECIIAADLQEMSGQQPVLFNPMRNEPPLMTGPRMESLRRPPKLKVLIIEPEPLLALELQESLSEAGYVPVGPATTVQSAFEAIGRGGVHAVVLDCSNIPGGQLEAIVDKLKTGSLPYVLVAEFDALHPVVYNDVPVLHKPVRPAALVEALTYVVPSASGPEGSA